MTWTLRRLACLSTAVLAAFLGQIWNAVACAQSVGTEPSKTVRDGSHDFDFIFGKWRMPNHRLQKRLADSHDWVDFVTCDVGAPLPGGIGNTDYWTSEFWKDFVGITFRTYDPRTGLWSIYWIDNRFSGGVIQPPVVGKFEGNTGVFEGTDTFQGKPISVRYTWKINPEGSPVVATWNQAFSTDQGKSWETNWYNEFIHDDHCTPSVPAPAR